MKWSFKVARIWGIDVYLHSTFLLLLLFFGVLDGLRSGNLATAVSTVVYLVCLFVCVLLHEYGHALAARRYGIPTRDITLLPIGGVARLERLPDNPRHELVIAIAGPAVNVAIAAALALGLLVAHAQFDLPGNSLDAVAFAQRLLVVNVFLVLFNLLPAFPMDGGRVLRALLAMMLDPLRATKIAAVIGKGMAVLFAAFALYSGQYMLLLIALFVWQGAQGEAAMAVARSELGRTLGDAQVGQAMQTEFFALAPGDTLTRAAQQLNGARGPAWPVMTGGEVVGALLRADLDAALPRSGDSVPVEQAMRRDFLTFEADEPLEPAVVRLASSGVPLAAVRWQARIVGILTPQGLGEFVARQRAGVAGQGRPPVIVNLPPAVPRQAGND